LGGVDGQGVQKSGLGLALFGDVLVFLMWRRLLGFGLSATILDFLWIGGEDGSQSLLELLVGGWIELNLHGLGPATLTL
jgi:hypothetical protein